MNIDILIAFTPTIIMFAVAAAAHYTARHAHDSETKTPAARTNTNHPGEGRTYARTQKDPRSQAQAQGSAPLSTIRSHRRVTHGIIHAPWCFAGIQAGAKCTCHEEV